MSEDRGVEMNEDGRTSAGEGHDGGHGSEGWFDRPKNVNRIYYALLTICIGLVAADLLYHKHVHFGFEEWFGVYGFFGFLAFFFIVLAGKQLRKILMRAEDYYDE